MSRQLFLDNVEVAMNMLGYSQSINGNNITAMQCPYTGLAIASSRSADAIFNYYFTTGSSSISIEGSPTGNKDYSLVIDRIISTIRMAIKMLNDFGQVLISIQHTEEPPYFIASFVYYSRFEEKEGYIQVTKDTGDIMQIKGTKLFIKKKNNKCELVSDFVPFVFVNTSGNPFLAQGKAILSLDYANKAAILGEHITCITHKMANPIVAFDEQARMRKDPRSNSVYTANLASGVAKKVYDFSYDVTSLENRLQRLESIIADIYDIPLLYGNNQLARIDALNKYKSTVYDSIAIPIIRGVSKIIHKNINLGPLDKITFDSDATIGERRVNLENVTYMVNTIVKLAQINPNAITTIEIGKLIEKVSRLTGSTDFINSALL